MAASPTSEMTEQLAKDYASYAKVNLSGQMKDFRDSIEDVMMRLEEFQSIVVMVQTEGAECINNHVPSLQHMQKDLTNLCKRIDALEHVIATANVNLCALEAAVDSAEAELGVSDRLFGILNPLSFFKKTQDPVPSNRVSTFEQPTIYRTDDFFTRE